MLSVTAGSVYHSQRSALRRRKWHRTAALWCAPLLLPQETGWKGAPGCMGSVLPCRAEQCEQSAVSSLSFRVEWKSSLCCPCVAPRTGAGEASSRLCSFRARTVLLARSFVRVVVLHRLSELKPQAFVNCRGCRSKGRCTSVDRGTHFYPTFPVPRDKSSSRPP